MKPVCLVMGAGAGIGGTVAGAFAAEGYHAVLCRRSDEAGLKRLVGDIETAGGTATGFLLNAIEPDVIEDRVAHIEAEIGPIEVVVFNLGAQIGNRLLKDTTAKAFETGWRLATFALFRLASAVTPHMTARGKGTILVTSSTAAVRGNRPAFTRGGDGRAPHAVPVPQCRVRTPGNPRRPHYHRWIGGRA